MKYILMIIVAVSMTACGAVDRQLARFTGNATETCHKGVAYLQFTSGATVKYNPDGTIANCT